MRIVVTGAGGRLGTAVVARAARRGYTVTAVDRIEPTGSARAGVEVVVADLADHAGLVSAMRGADGVIHLAAHTSPRDLPEPQVHNDNVTASYNALSAAQVAGVRRICVASSVNAIGGVYSEMPRYDWFPVDESHPSYAEDGYSLSKWIVEQQGAAFARRTSGASIAALRLHALRGRAQMAALRAQDADMGWKDLWGYTPMTMAAEACLAAVERDLGGFETLNVVAEDNFTDEPSMGLREQYYPSVPLRQPLPGRASFIDSAKARKLLW